LAKLEIANTMVKTLIIIIWLALSASTSSAQKRDSIYYYVPTSVKAKILDYMKEKEPRAEHPFYMILSHQNDTAHVLISRYGDSPKELAYLIKNSNRYIKLNSTKTLPVLLGDDFAFSNLLHSVKKEGDPYAIFRHLSINPSGYLIEFYGLYDKARVIKAQYFQY
jgi:hypothetical protein